MTTTPHPVVVGVDGTPGSMAAVRWGAGEALRRVRPLRLLHVYRWPPNYGPTPIYTAWPPRDPLEIKRTAEELVAESARVARAAQPEVEVLAESVEGHPATELLSAGGQAAVLVLGSRELGPFGSMVLGSVGTAVASRAPCPVVVVRGPAGDPGTGAQVVAGIDGGETSAQVLEYAFEHASRYQAGVRAVLCWWPHVYELSGWLRDSFGQAASRAEAWLAEALAGWRQKYPDVPVSASVVQAHAVSGLVTAAAGAHLLVVGSRGRHALAGTLLGSVSAGVLHHAGCPVAVLPAVHPGPQPPAG
jgi:nucleotide-binding universal stress UspA family protein